jgi:hypothetical protein
MTKSVICDSDASRCLGDGRTLSIYIIFGSGETHDPSRVLEITTPDFLDKDGEPLAFCYTCNNRASVNEGLCEDYVDKILRPALGYPLPRDTHPGDQGVFICDGVGSHLCFTMAEKVIELGIEILLRVPTSTTFYKARTPFTLR